MRIKCEWILCPKICLSVDKISSTNVPSSNIKCNAEGAGLHSLHFNTEIWNDLILKSVIQVAFAFTLLGSGDWGSWVIPWYCLIDIGSAKLLLMGVIRWSQMASQVITGIKSNKHIHSFGQSTKIIDTSYPILNLFWFLVYLACMVRSFDQ